MNPTRSPFPPSTCAVVGALLIAYGLLLGAQFILSAPVLFGSIREAARAGHLTLGLIGAVYMRGRGVGLLGGVSALLLITAGILVLCTAVGVSSVAHVRRQAPR